MPEEASEYLVRLDRSRLLHRASPWLHALEAAIAAADAPAARAALARLRELLYAF